MKSIDKPHDRFARAALSDVTVASDFLRAYLPKEVTKRIDFKTLALTNGSFIDEYCRQYYTDLVYTCKIDKRDGYIYCILETQSTPDELMAFRILSYVVDLLKTYLKQHPNAKKLPIVIGLCVYHGRRSPYPYSTDIHDCFEDPELVRRCRVFQEFQLTDLTTISEEEVTSHGTACLMEMLLKQSHTRDFVKAVNILVDSAAHILKNLKNEYFNESAQYMGNVGNPIIVKKALDLLTNALPEKKEIQKKRKLL
ncbi:MAG: Rpn family recombination-promoting nuclease/putative transposase [Cytophagales bacterium]|nr:Rpn family recombination-promoting nuclease/putative transposase [Cytophagales bacterium]